MSFETIIIIILILIALWVFSIFADARPDNNYPEERNIDKIIQEINDRINGKHKEPPPYWVDEVVKEDGTHLKRKTLIRGEFDEQKEGNRKFRLIQIKPKKLSKNKGSRTKKHKILVHNKRKDIQRRK